MKELKTAENLLKNNRYSCVISNGKEILYTSVEKGIKPLLEFYDNNQFKNSRLYVADKIIGKGAAFLLVLFSAKGLYTPVISESALDLLQRYGIAVKYDKIVSYIKNRTGDGRCPIESAVIDEDDPKTAYNKIVQKIKELTKEITTEN